MRFIDKVRASFQQAKKQHKNDPKLLTKHLLQHISDQLLVLSENLEQRIEDIASGKRAPPDSNYEYIIKDRTGTELQSEWSDIDYISREDILKSHGYVVLSQTTSQLGVNLEILTEQCLEYDDEDRVHYIVLFSGWG